jgi:hypothetical protein
MTIHHAALGRASLVEGCLRGGPGPGLLAAIRSRRGARPVPAVPLEADLESEPDPQGQSGGMTYLWESEGARRRPRLSDLPGR